MAQYIDTARWLYLNADFLCKNHSDRCKAEQGLRRFKNILVDKNSSSKGQ